MSLDEIFEKMKEVKIRVANPLKAKTWLFEYGCAVSEAYGLKPESHKGFVRYCGVHFMMRQYKDALYGLDDPNYQGFTMDFREYKAGPKSIPKRIKRQYKMGTLPRRDEYLDMIHRDSGPIEGLEDVY